MECPDYIQPILHETACMENHGADRRRLWAVILNVKIMQDGDQFCCLYGENLQEGIAAFGDTPEHAIFEFEKMMTEKVSPTPTPEAKDE